MACTRRGFVSLASGATLLGLSACSLAAKPEEQGPAPEPEQPKEQKDEVDTKKFAKLAIDNKAWKYDEASNVYYQLGIPYCLEPVSEAYESLAIFVPGAYMTAEKDGNSLKCSVNKQGTVGKFTAATAPIVMPINSGTLNPQSCPTSYSYAGLQSYLAAGFIYVYAGFRGKSSGFVSGSQDVFPGGAPWPVVDLKAAVRFLRYNAAEIPGDKTRVFSCGFSVGGGVSAVLAASGDSSLYNPYLEKIGAITHDAEGNKISDALYGSATWCPMTSFNSADASYEWMMGQYANGESRAEGTWTRLLSLDLARAYAGYVNNMGFRDDEDNALTLDETTGEVYADGSYYLHLLGLIEKSADDFFANTAFPYTFTPQYMANANFPGDPNLQSVGTGGTDVEAVTGDASAQAAGGTGEGAAQVQSTVYETQTDYVNALNGDEWWLTYNERRGSVRLTTLGDFVRHLKTAAKGVCAFDAVNRSTTQNQIFGVEDASTLHFSSMVSNQLVAGREAYAGGTGWQDVYVQDWTGDLTEVDALKTSMETRVNMFDPLYFLCGSNEGFGTAAVAPHWRINSGLFQTDTSLCTEANLALALKHYEGVADVAFTPVWGQGHVLAEVSGTAEENLINWIIGCCQ